jgi:hypothetical protein
MGSVEGYISTFLEQLICSSRENSKEKKTAKKVQLLKLAKVSITYTRKENMNSRTNE